MIDKPKRKKRQRRPQQRGNIKRDALMDAVDVLLAERPLSDVTLREFAEQAGLPIGSCYHFYKSKLELIKAYVDGRVIPDFRKYVLGQAFVGEKIKHWEDLAGLIIERAVEFYETNPAAREVLIGRSVPPEVYVEARARERVLADDIKRIFQRYFVLPTIPYLDEAFFLYVEIADRIISLSYIENGIVTEKGQEEAILAAISYLRNYLPPKLSRRSTESVTANSETDLIEKITAGE